MSINPENTISNSNLYSNFSNRPFPIFPNGSRIGYAHPSSESNRIQLPSLPSTPIPSIPLNQPQPIHKKPHCLHRKKILLKQAQTESEASTLSNSTSVPQNPPRTSSIPDPLRVRMEIQKKAAELGIIPQLKKRSTKLPITTSAMVNGHNSCIKEMREYLLTESSLRKFPQTRKICRSGQRLKKFDGIKEAVQILLKDGSLFRGFDDQGGLLPLNSMSEKEIELISSVWAQKALCLGDFYSLREEALMRTAIQAERGIDDCRSIFERVYHQEQAKIQQS